MSYGQVKGATITGAGAGTLAFTGAASIPWLIIASLTLLAVGIALLRLVPKTER
jgi:hypothetical protein